MNFKYCPNCKANVKNNDRVLECKKCKFCYYFSPGPGVDIILYNEKKEVLLAKRSRSPGKGTWDMPGGFVEFGENVESAARREVNEELGIKVSKLNYLGSYTDRYYYKGINYHTLSISFYSFTKIKQFIPDDDVSEVQFFSLSKLPKQLFSPRIKKTLNDFKKILKTL